GYLPFYGKNEVYIKDGRGPWRLWHQVDDFSASGAEDLHYVLKRDEFGIVKSIRVDGTAANAEINGEEEIKRLLSGSTLRSNLFYIRPIMKGKFPEFFIIKGVGTGNFTGLCVYGANYLSKNMGYNYKQLLKHYFPNAVLR
ncbi:MAG: hypothetical protein N2Z60_07370, partial [Elusimicrobiales bacterium]|nr:hypothetical protein [Elusimicrobiales bacterium]